LVLTYQPPSNTLLAGTTSPRHTGHGLRREKCHQIIRNLDRERERRNSLVTLCKLTPALRLSIFITSKLRGQPFWYPLTMPTSRFSTTFAADRHENLNSPPSEKYVFYLITLTSSSLAQRFSGEWLFSPPNPALVLGVTKLFSLDLFGNSR
jgi:hypothetical protein